ncbi:MAG: spermidine/putrescine ABC transporter substrate-binding protein, partial [Actinomycetota bacterium]|nr:spermidine/putrescine ABC transporter substrate-binding protein [Actinomycetota bacterium]
MSTGPGGRSRVPGLQGPAGASMSRRSFLASAGRISAGAAAASLLASCGVGSPGEQDAGPEPRTLPPLAEELVIAQWPAFIDQVKGSSPTLKMFERRTGIDTTYKEVINDNQEFFAKLREPLSRGQDTGWDIITLSD